MNTHSEIHTLESFTAYYNELKKVSMGRLYHPQKFKVTKTKITKKAITTQRPNQIYGTGWETIVIEPAKKCTVVDTNGLAKLYQAASKYLYNCKMKRISSEGKWREGIGYIPSTNKGFADLHGIIDGYAIYCEMKQPNETHLDSQKKFKTWVESHKGFYFIATNFKDFQIQMNAIMAKIKALPSRFYMAKGLNYEITGTRTADNGQVFDTIRREDGKLFEVERNKLLENVTDWIKK